MCGVCVQHPGARVFFSFALLTDARLSPYPGCVSSAVLKHWGACVLFPVVFLFSLLIIPSCGVAGSSLVVLFIVS